MNPQRVMCDCCDQRPWTRHDFVLGIETFYCAVCAGLSEEEAEEEWQEAQDVQSVP